VNDLIPPKKQEPHIFSKPLWSSLKLIVTPTSGQAKLLTNFQKPQPIPQEKNPTHNQPLPPELSHCSRVAIQSSSEIEIASFVFIDLQV